MPQISPRHALTPEEAKFCRVFLAFGEKNAAEAYRRAFLKKIDGYYFDDDQLKDGVVKPGVAHLESHAVAKRAKSILGQDYIIAYIAEIKGTTGDQARQVLAEQLLFSEDERSARASAEHVLEQEDKYGFRDAVERHAQILCDIDAEVVVPLPRKVKVDVLCAECGHLNVIEKQLEVSFPVARLFPQFAKSDSGG